MDKVFAYELRIKTSSGVKELAALELELKDVNTALREAQKQGDQELYANLKQEQLLLRDRISDTRKELRAQVKDFKQAQFPEDSIVGLRRQYNALAKQIRETSQEDDGFDDLVKRADQLAVKIRETSKSFGDFRPNIGNYQESVEEAIKSTQALFGSGGAGSIFDSFQQGIVSTTQKLGPYGAAVGVAVTATAALFKFVNDLTLEYEKLNDRVADVTQLRGFDLTNATVQIKTLSEVFDQDFNDVLLAANTLTKEVTGDFDESFELIKLGFIGGADASGEFLDSLREYSTQVREAGIDGATFLEILIRSEQEGIFSDKGIDAVKEFGLRIREQTTASRDALNAAFGQEFTEELFGGINDGSITTQEALSRVTKGLQNTELTAQQTQTVIADVFGGAGEDAGERFLDILGQVDGNLEDLVDTTSIYSQRQLEAFEATERLNSEQQQLAAQFAGSALDVDTLTTRFKALGLSLLNDVVTGFRAVGNQVRKGNILQVIAGLFNPGVLATSVIQVAAEDAAAYAEEQEKIAAQEEAIAAQRRAAAIDGRLGIEDLRQEQALLRQEIDAARVAGEDYSEAQSDYIKVTNQLAEASSIVNRTATDSFKDLQVAASTSLAGLSERVSELKRDLEEAPDAEAYLRYYRQLIGAEDALRVAQEERNRAVAGDRDSTVTQTLQRDFQTDGSVDELARFVGDELQLGSQAAIEREQSVQDALTRAREAGLKDREDLAKKEREIQTEEAERLKEAVLAQASSTGEQLGEITAQFALGQITSLKEFSKQFLVLALDVLDRQVNIFLTEIALKEFASKGILGAATTGIIVGIVRGLFSAARSAVQSFAGGGEVQPIELGPGRIAVVPNAPWLKNGDNVVATVRAGEMILNERQQRNLEGIAGPSIWNAIGVPGFIDGGVVAATPQFVSVSEVVRSEQTIQFDQESLRELGRYVADALNASVPPALENAITNAQTRQERLQNLRRSR